MKSKIGNLAGSAAVALAMCAQVAWGAQSGSWGQSQDASYDTSVPGTILMYKSELSQGGFEFVTKSMTTDPKQADIVFDTGSTLGANSVIDLGKVAFDSVSAIPSSGYSTEVSVAVGHVYVVQTHDGSYAKLLITSVAQGSIGMTFALLNQSSSGGNQGNSAGSRSGSGSGSGSQSETSGGKGSGSKSGNMATYDTTFTSPILVVNNPLSQGGYNLATKSMTRNASQADIAFGDNGNTIAARSVVDMGPVNYTVVNSVPNYGATEMKVIPRHVYVVKTHDNRYAKVLVQAVLAKQVQFQFAYLNAKPTPANNSGATSGGNTKGAGKGKGSAGGSGKNTGKSSGDSGSSNRKKTVVNIAAFVGHKWRLFVPGSSYTLDDYANDSSTTVTSLGASAGSLLLSANGTYIWSDPIDGTMKGKWQKTTDSDWPIVLLSGAEKHDWKLGKASKQVWGGGDIVIWDGYTWENGVK